MARYPDWTVGKDVSATNLALGIPNIVVKTAGESRSATATLANDAELVGIPLAVGTHWIRLVLTWITDTTATPDIKTQWAFTGTWNNPLRCCMGPASGNTAGPDAVTPLKLASIATNANAVYGTNGGTSYFCATEETFRAVVTVTGNLSLQWAQNTSDASNTTVKDHSAFETRQIA